VLLTTFRKYSFLEKITSDDVNMVIRLEAEAVLSLRDHVRTLTMHDGVITTDKSTFGGTYRIVLRLQKAYREKLGILPIVKCPPPIERYDGLMDLTDNNVIPVKWDAVVAQLLEFLGLSNLIQSSSTTNITDGTRDKHISCNSAEELSGTGRRRPKGTRDSRRNPEIEACAVEHGISYPTSKKRFQRNSNNNKTGKPEEPTAVVPHGGVSGPRVYDPRTQQRMAA
jgi:hypothetical protein